MISLVEMGKVKTVIVKDMSRMGRDYLKVGYYTESFFAEKDVRYIAISDSIDSATGENDFTPFRNLFNDFVKKIMVHAPDKSSGHRRQKIQLVWNFIGEVNLPNDDQTVERERKSKTA